MCLLAGIPLSARWRTGELTGLLSLTQAGEGILPNNGAVGYVVIKESVSHLSFPSGKMDSGNNQWVGSAADDIF